MDFESVEQVAKRLQVTTRTVQKWAKDGKIPGASQMGRTWLIPDDFMGPVVCSGDDDRRNVDPPAVDHSKAEYFTKTGHPAERGQAPIRPLLDSVFEPGHCLEYVQSFPEGVHRDVMMA